jgi:hypothetical protein
MKERDQTPKLKKGPLFKQENNKNHEQYVLETHTKLEKTMNLKITH